jgi:hypothetical protein
VQRASKLGKDPQQCEMVRVCPQLQTVMMVLGE